MQCMEETQSLLMGFFLYAAIHWKTRVDRDEVKRNRGALGFAGIRSVLECFCATKQAMFNYLYNLLDFLYTNTDKNDKIS